MERAATSKRVVFVNNAYWPSIGGVENSIRHLAGEARARGHEVSIVASDIGLSATTNRPSQEPVGVPIYRYAQEPLAGKLLKPLNALLSAWQLFRILRSIHRAWPDATVIARHHYGVIAARVAGFKCVRYLVPSIISLQVGAEVALDNRRHTLAERLRRKLFVLLHASTQKIAIRSSKLYVFSRTMQRQCAELVGDRLDACTITKPGVDKARFHPIPDADVLQLRERLGLPTAKPIVLFVGRFVKAKRGVDILNALASLPDCHAVFVGAGPEGGEYERLIEVLSLDNRVTIFGPSRDVEKYYQCADVFVMSSSYEPLGQTTLEALCSGLLVAAYRSGGEVDTATQELGMDEFIRYAEKLSVASLAGAIQRAIEDARHLDKEALSERVAQRFSWARLYHELSE